LDSLRVRAFNFFIFEHSSLPVVVLRMKDLILVKGLPNAAQRRRILTLFLQQFEGRMAPVGRPRKGTIRASKSELRNTLQEVIKTVEGEK
jgi:hypothetical protein